MAHLWKGKALFGSRDIEEALKEFDIVLSIEPENLRALSDKGATLLVLERYDEAVEIYNTMLSLEPRHIWALCGKGASLSQLERYDEALEAYNAALYHDPKFEHAKDAALALKRLISFRPSRRFLEQVWEFSLILNLQRCLTTHSTGARVSLHVIVKLACFGVVCAPG